MKKQRFLTFRYPVYNKKFASMCLFFNTSKNRSDLDCPLFRYSIFTHNVQWLNKNNNLNYQKTNNQWLTVFSKKISFLLNLESFQITKI